MAHRLQWDGPTKNVDGSVFDQTQFAGYELELDGRPSVAIPVAWDSDNKYDFDLRSVGLTFGQHKARIRVVNKTGKVSDFSNQVEFTYADERVPSPPLALTAV